MKVILGKLLPKNWNDVLALVLIVGIPFIWKYGDLPGDAPGATILAWGLVIQFYFRRSPPKE